MIDNLAILFSFVGFGYIIYLYKKSENQDD